MRKFSTSLWVSRLLFAGQGFAGLAQARTVTDITHRTVEVPDKPQRIVVGESRMLYTLALVQDGNSCRSLSVAPSGRRSPQNRLSNVIK
jgi:iron complex transport system substrate-binding protein